MKKLVSFVRNNYIFLSPVFTALYTALFLYAANSSEFTLSVIITPLLSALFFAVVVFLVVLTFVRQKPAAALVSFAVVFVSLSYVRIASLVSQIPFVSRFPISEDAITWLVIFIILVFVSIVVKRYKGKLLSANKVLTILSLALVLFSAFNIAKFEITSGRLFEKDTKNVKMNITQVPYLGTRPDIYYFIFDRYAGSRALSEQYGFDNSAFLNFLRGKGFYVPTNSTTNYPKTFLSLASSLNFEYLDFLTAQTHGGASSDESIITPLIRNNNVVKFLKERGYSYINVGSWWEATSVNQNANKNFVLHYGVYPFADEFMTGYLNTTIAAPILKATFKDPMAVSTDPQNNLHRKTILYELDTFKTIPQMPGPKFVFAHILVPHDPFVLDQNCKPIDEGIVNTKPHQTNYLNQLKCANSKIEVLVNQILENSKIPPVIIF
ncbi:MAG: sulfatase-like hydrolase/transferase, partial [Candidatus Levyibacteriota bacterium]